MRLHLETVLAYQSSFVKSPLFLAFFDRYFKQAAFVFKTRFNTCFDAYFKVCRPLREVLFITLQVNSALYLCNHTAISTIKHNQATSNAARSTSSQLHLFLVCSPSTSSARHHQPQLDIR
jgi:hypothetical protein